MKVFVFLFSVTAGRDCGSRGVLPASDGAGRATVF
nr:MAG TPA: hypothetical protein [Bacteriophage sp.]